MGVRKWFRLSLERRSIVWMSKKSVIRKACLLMRQIIPLLYLMWWSPIIKLHGWDCLGSYRLCLYFMLLGRLIGWLTACHVTARRRSCPMAFATAVHFWQLIFLRVTLKVSFASSTPAMANQHWWRMAVVNLVALILGPSVKIWELRHVCLTSAIPGKSSRKMEHA